MLKNLFIPFFFLFGVSVLAQTSDPAAKKILDAVSAKMKGYETMKFEFTYTMENQKEKIKESKSGSIYTKGDKYLLYIADQKVICDGKTTWTYLKEDNEVQINDVDPNNDNTPNKMLTAYGDNYRPKLIKEMPKAGKVIQVIDLTPIKSRSFYKIRIEIDKAAQMVYSSTIYDKNGSTYTYTVNNFVPNPKVNDTRFTFNKAEYPGVTVNDMR